MNRILKPTLFTALASILATVASVSQIHAQEQQQPMAQEQQQPAQEALGFGNRDQLVCYAWSAFPNERLKLDIKPHSRLSEPVEEKRFNHPAQVAYSVHGKEIGGCGGNSMGTVTGTIVTAKKGGAHLGVVAHFSRGNGQFFGNDFCRSITFDCTTDEETPVPNIWRCQSRNEFDVYHGNSVLRKVNEAQDPRCSIFQNGTFANTAQATEAVSEVNLAEGGSATRTRAAQISSGAASSSQGQNNGEGILAQLRQRFGRPLTEQEACYVGCRGAGAHDLICRFFCDLRPFTIGGLLIPE